VSKIPGTTRHPTHRLGVLAAALAVTMAGLVSAVPAQAAPAPAPAAAPAPDNYTPRPGALFNKPIGTRAEQYRLFTHINRAINSARAGSVIRIAVFSFSDGRTADNLIKAHRRGVHVKLVFDNHTIYDAERKLQRALGRNPSRGSFAVFCDKSCRSTSGEMHAKVYMFRRSGSAQWITMVGSNNMTSTNAEKQWSDLVTVRGNRDVYNTFRHWFAQLKWDKPVADPRMAVASGTSLALITPQDSKVYGDPAMKALAPVVCDPGTGKHTRILISAHAWYGPRGNNIANRIVTLAGQGCIVKVFYGEAFGSTIHQKLQDAGVALATSRHKGVKTHQKLLIVRGGYGGNDDAAFAWTGSHNWSPWAMKVDDVILRTANRDTVWKYTKHFSWMFRYA